MDVNSPAQDWRWPAVFRWTLPGRSLVLVLAATDAEQERGAV